MLNYKIKFLKSCESVKRGKIINSLLNYKIIRNFKIMLNYTISRMCMNNIKNNIKYTNTLCRDPDMSFFEF